MASSGDDECKGVGRVAAGVRSPAVVADENRGRVGYIGRRVLMLHDDRRSLGRGVMS